MRKLFFVFYLIPTLLLAQSENISLLDHWKIDSLPLCNDGESVFNEVWGLTLNGKYYAVLGSTAGTHFFEIKNNRLFEISFIKGRYSGSLAVHRDYHDYNGFLYAVCDEGASSLQIMDLQYLPDSVSLVYDNDSLFIRAHNIFIDTTKAKLYVCAVSSYQGFNAMNVYDISSPIVPNLIYNYNAVGHVHDAYVYNDTAFLNCGGEGLRVVNSSIGNIPIQIGQLSTYLQKGYNHSGWLNVDKTSYVMCDENLGLDVKVLKVSDLDDIEVNSFFNSEMGDDDKSVAHNVIVRNNIAYLSYYHDGLQVFDVSTPNQPKKLAYYDTYPGDPNVSWAGAWGVYPFGDGSKILVSDRANGLFLFGFDPPPVTVDQPFYIFPNPAKNFIYFFRDHFGNADYNLIIYDVYGNKLESYSGNNDYFKIENLDRYKSGIYFIKYYSNLDSTTLTLKFLIQ